MRTTIPSPRCGERSPVRPLDVRRRDFVQTMTALAALPRQGNWKSWRVNGSRVNQHLADLSKFGANPQGGVSRVAFSDADIAGRRFMMDLMRAVGLAAGIDPAGNIFGVRAGSRPSALPLLFGSHIDSVPEGGNYDGDVGSCSAIEVAHTLLERGYRNRHPLHVVIWCDEESGLTGSRGFIGDLPPDEIARPGRDGVLLADKIRRIDGDPARIAEARHGPGSIAAYVELHIEQGGILDERGINIGIVEGIVGIHHYDVTLRGFANHAGTTPMDRRQNAMLAAAELVLIVDRGTVGRGTAGWHGGTAARETGGAQHHPGAGRPDGRASRPLHGKDRAAVDADSRGSARQRQEVRGDTRLHAAAHQPARAVHTRRPRRHYGRGAGARSLEPGHAEWRGARCPRPGAHWPDGHDLRAVGEGHQPFAARADPT